MNQHPALAENLSRSTSVSHTGMKRKSSTVALALISYLCAAGAAVASVTITPSQDTGPSPSATAGAQAPNDQTQSQTFGPSSENPFNHTASASDSNEFGSTYADAMLNLSYSNSSIVFSGSSDAGVSLTIGSGGASSYELFYAYITVSDEAVPFTLSASTNASGTSAAFVFLGDLNNNTTWEFSGGQSGTVSGTLSPGTYRFQEAVNTATSNGATNESSGGSVSGQLDLGVIPEPSAALSMIVGCGVLLSKRKRSSTA